MLLVRTYVAPSVIQGLGLFAGEPIAAGTIVWKHDPVFDIVVHEDELRRLSPPALEQFMKYSYYDDGLGGFVLCFDDARFMNHSTEPNLDDSSTVTRALVDIAHGDELTCNYAAFDDRFAEYAGQLR